MNISNFITLGRQVFRTLDSLTFKDRSLIKAYIELLEDELVRISNETQKPIKRDEIELKTEINRTSRFTEAELNQNMLKFYKSTKFKIPFKYLEYSKEFNNNPFNKKFKNLEDIEWLKLNYPKLYAKQRQLAYFRVNQKFKRQNKS